MTRAERRSVIIKFFFYNFIVYRRESKVKRIESCNKHWDQNTTENAMILYTVALLTALYYFDPVSDKSKKKSFNFSDC